MSPARRFATLMSSVSLAVLALGGCAFVFGYGDYHARGEGGAGGSASGSGGASAHGGGGAGSTGGAAGGGGAPICTPGSGAGPYGVVWSKAFATQAGGTLAGVHVDAAGVVSLAATFSGKIHLGATLDAGAHDAILLGQFAKDGGLLFATALSGADDVTASALAVDPTGDPYVFGTFGKDVTIDGTTYTVTPTGSQNAVMAGFTKEKGALLPGTAQQIPCALAGALTSCAVTVNAARLDGSSLYLAGTFSGTVSFADDQMTNKLAALDVDGFAAIWGQRALDLRGNGDEQNMTGFAPTSDGDLVLGGTVATANTVVDQSNKNVCTLAIATTDSDVFILKYKPTAPAGPVWSCTTALVAPGIQTLDALAPMDDGGVVIAGRTDGQLNLGTGSMSVSPGIFVARLSANRDVVWSQSIAVTTKTPVRLEAAADYKSLLLSGTFEGPLATELGEVQSSGVNGFVSVLDAETTGDPQWTRALVPCQESSPTTLVASWTHEKSIVIAGTLSRPSQIAGVQIGEASGAAFYVATLGM